MQEGPVPQQPPEGDKPLLTVRGLTKLFGSFKACAEGLRSVPGVMDAQVNAATQRARVVWSPAETQPSRWFAASSAAGYPLLPAAMRVNG